MDTVNRNQGSLGFVCVLICFLARSVFTITVSYEPRHDKTNKVSVRPAKTLIRLGIRLRGCPGLSESSLGEQSFCWFCHEAAQLFLVQLHLIHRKIVQPIFYNLGTLCMEYLFFSYVWTIFFTFQFIFQSPDGINMPVISLGSSIRKQSQWFAHRLALSHCVQT